MARYNRADKDSAVKAALSSAQNSGARRYVVPTANGWSVEKRDPGATITRIICRSDGSSELVRTILGAPSNVDLDRLIGKATDAQVDTDAAELANAYKTQSEAAARRLWAEKIKGLNYGQQIILQDKMAKLIKSKAHDSLSFNTLFWAGIIAALIAKHYGPKETVGMGSYDLRTYQPERKTW